MAFDNMDKNGKDYTNGEIVVTWTPRLCDHSGVCISELPDVFNSIKRPWIIMDGAPSLAIQRVVDLCPTRALTWKKVEKTEAVIETDKEKETEIALMKNGQIRISGNFKLIDENGNIISCADKVSLCRCAKSKRLPFCDGSHRH